MTQLERYTHNGWTITIDTDDDPMSPREADNLGVMVCWHRNYFLGDATEHRTDYNPSSGVASEVKATIDRHDRMVRTTVLTRWLRIFYGATVVLPLYTYEHGGITMSTGTFAEDGAGWDTSRVGFIFDTPERREVTGVPLDKVEEGLRAEVAEYATYLEGGYVGFTVLDNRGDVYESGWGYSDIDDCKRQAEACVPATPDTTIPDGQALDDIARIIRAGNVVPQNVVGIVQRTGRKVTNG